jgi:lipoprotein Spr
MVKKHLFSVAIVFFLGAYHNVYAQKGPKSNIKFLDDIELSFNFPEDNSQMVKTKAAANAATLETSERKLTSILAESTIERASLLQFKYALLLDTEVEFINNANLFSLIDDWFGTPYRLGGSGKAGIDCSAFMQVMYTGVLGISLPRTAREQFNAVKKISRTELQEGDLVFFNTRGGVSHVGYYLTNNKFVHASSSNGVTISDLYDDYWSKRFVGAGRYEKEQNEFLSKL